MFPSLSGKGIDIEPQPQPYPIKPSSSHNNLPRDISTCTHLPKAPLHAPGSQSSRRQSFSFHHSHPVTTQYQKCRHAKPNSSFQYHHHLTHPFLSFPRSTVRSHESDMKKKNNKNVIHKTPRTPTSHRAQNPTSVAHRKKPLFPSGCIELATTPPSRRPLFHISTKAATFRRCWKRRPEKWSNQIESA